MRSTWIFLIILLLSACEKDDEVMVKYVISNNSSGYKVNYLNESGDLKQEAIESNSAQDKWSYSFTAEKGQIIFVSAIYKDISDGIKVAILIDGKTYKQGSSNNDTLSYVTVSGTVPYN